jgi:hypothetical protein
MSAALAEKTTTSFHRGHRGTATDEAVGSLFQPDSLLLEQYLDTTRRKIVLEPEKRLMLAILKDAVGTFQADLFAANAKSSRRFEQARDWITETDAIGFFHLQTSVNIWVSIPRTSVTVYCVGWRTNWQISIGALLGRVS